MADKTYLVESELLTQMQDLQQRFNAMIQQVATLQSSCVQKLRKGGTAGFGTTRTTLGRINAEITDATDALQESLRSFINDLSSTFDITISGSPSNGDYLSNSNISVGADIAPFFGVSDAGDIPYAWWINDTDEIFLGTEVDPDSDLIAELGLADNDIIYVQDTNAVTNEDSPTIPQKGRRLLVVDAEGDNTHAGTNYFGNIQLSLDVETPYPLRDVGALTTDTRVKDTRLILRKVYDAVV